MRKRIIAWGILLTLVFVTAGKAAPSRVVRVGYFGDTGFLQQLEDGSYYGYCYEYLQNIAGYTGWEYEFVKGTWKQCLDRLEKGEIDLLCLAQQSPERQARFYFSRYEAGIEYAALLVSQDNQTVFYNDYPAFDGMRIALLSNSYQNELLREFANDHGFGYTPLAYPTTEECMQALADGRVDAVLSGSLQKLAQGKVVAKFAPEPFYFITNKENGLLLESLNHAMEDIQTSDVDYAARLYNRYYGESSMLKVALTKEEAEFVALNKKVRVTFNGNWSPVTEFNQLNGGFSGILAEIMERISKNTGLAFEYIPVSSAKEAAEMVRDGRAEIVCGFAGSLADASQYFLNVTKPVAEIPVSISKNPSMPFQDIKKVAAPCSCSFLMERAQEMFPEAEILPFADTEGCMDAVKSRKADAVFDNIYVLDQYEKDGHYLDMETLVSARVEVPLYLGVNSMQSPALRSLLNKGISQMSEREINEITIAATNVDPQLHVELILRQYVMPGAAFLFLILIVILLHSKMRIERCAFVDPLTGHDNQTKFNLTAERAIKSHVFSGGAVVSLDVDKFKLVNNMLNFETGNRILRQMSDVMAQSLETGEQYCREYGDHFIMLLKASSKEDLETRLSSILEQLCVIPRQMGYNYQYTVSCGVYCLGPDEHHLHRAIGWANLARKTAKGLRQNAIVYYDEAMKERATKEQEIENRMEDALDNGEFTVFYQAKVSLTDEKLVGAEALVRWMPSDGSVYYPDEFIPVFEENGFIIKLDLFVFEQVCKQQRAWIDKGITPRPVSVNLSRVHLNQEYFYLQYYELMDFYRVPRELIELELTESTIFENKMQMVALMQELKSAGVTVSMDDFGSGYSSLNLLKDLPIDIIKLDREFLNTSSNTGRGQKIIGSVVYMANELGIEVIAEGVETQEQADFLRNIHCSIAQGYYFSRPVPSKVFENMLQ